ncbi:MAG TPA: hypothetical protein VM406_15260 [Noviherbaspirillum sp.]|nr:hypothetical protein [Noviherbaspirillum sp.]
MQGPHASHFQSAHHAHGASSGQPFHAQPQRPQLTAQQYVQALEQHFQIPGGSVDYSALHRHLMGQGPDAQKAMLDHSHAYRDFLGVANENGLRKLFQQNPGPRITYPEAPQALAGAATLAGKQSTANRALNQLQILLWQVPPHADASAHGHAYRQSVETALVNLLGNAERLTPENRLKAARIVNQHIRSLDPAAQARVGRAAADTAQRLGGHQPELRALLEPLAPPSPLRNAGRNHFFRQTGSAAPQTPPPHAGANPARLLGSLKQAGWTTAHLDALRNTLMQHQQAIDHGVDPRNVVARFNQEYPTLAPLFPVADPRSAQAMSHMLGALKMEHNATISPQQWHAELKQAGWSAQSGGHLDQLRATILGCLHAARAGAPPAQALQAFAARYPGMIDPAHPQALAQLHGLAQAIERDLHAHAAPAPASNPDAAIYTKSSSELVDAMKARFSPQQLAQMSQALGQLWASDTPEGREAVKLYNAQLKPILGENIEPLLAPLSSQERQDPAALRRREKQEEAFGNLRSELNEHLNKLRQAKPAQAEASNAAARRFPHYGGSPIAIERGADMQQVLQQLAQHLSTEQLRELREAIRDCASRGTLSADDFDRQYGNLFSTSIAGDAKAGYARLMRVLPK